MTELQLAEPKIDGIADGLELSDEVRERSKEIAHRCDMEYPINRSPTVVAASTVYLTALLNNEKVTQSRVKEQTGVCDAALRECYREIAEHEGYDFDGGQKQEQSGKKGLHWAARKLLGR